MKKDAVLLFALGVALAMAMNACGGPTSQPEQSTTAISLQSTPTALPEPQPGGTLVISYGIGPPRHFNPALISGSATAMIGAQIFASPLRYDENWNPLPYLAESWEGL